MNAQDWWKIQYAEFSSTFDNYTKSTARVEMYESAREAALERKLSAAQRTIEAQTKIIQEQRDTIQDLTI